MCIGRRRGHSARPCSGVPLNLPGPPQRSLAPRSRGWQRPESRGSSRFQAAVPGTRGGGIPGRTEAAAPPPTKSSARFALQRSGSAIGETAPGPRPAGHPLLPPSRCSASPVRPPARRRPSRARGRSLGACAESSRASRAASIHPPARLRPAPARVPPSPAPPPLPPLPLLLLRPRPRPVPSRCSAKPKMAGWQSYVDNLMCDGCCQEAAIVGYCDAKYVWAATAGGVFQSITVSRPGGGRGREARLHLHLHALHPNPGPHALFPGLASTRASGPPGPRVGAALGARSCLRVTGSPGQPRSGFGVGMRNGGTGLCSPILFYFFEI